jgi:hypothetical protein
MAVNFNIWMISDADPSLAPLQLGVGIQGRANIIAINAVLVSDPANTVVPSHHRANVSMPSARPTSLPLWHLSAPLFFNVNLVCDHPLSIGLLCDSKASTLEVTRPHRVFQAHPLGPLPLPPCSNTPFRPSPLHAYGTPTSPAYVVAHKQRSSFISHMLPTGLLPPGHLSVPMSTRWIQCMQNCDDAMGTSELRNYNVWNVQATEYEGTFRDGAVVPFE